MTPFDDFLPWILLGLFTFVVICFIVAMVFFGAQCFGAKPETWLAPKKKKEPPTV